jgi:hypothetical protein
MHAVSNLEHIEWFVRRPARQLGLNLCDWMLSRDLWGKINHIVEQGDYFEFIKWAEAEGLIVVRPWKGNWVELKLTSKGQDLLSLAP